MEMRLNCVLWLQRVGVFKVFKQIFSQTQKTFRLKGCLKQSCCEVVLGVACEVAPWVCHPTLSRDCPLCCFQDCPWGRLRSPLRSHRRLPPRFASQVDFKVTSDGALPGCLASLLRQDAPDVAPEFAPKFSSRCCLQAGLDVTMYWGCPTVNQ